MEKGLDELIEFKRKDGTHASISGSRDPVAIGFTEEERWNSHRKRGRVWSAFTEKGPFDTVCVFLGES